MKGKQTFTCILEIECSFQMTFHLPVSGRRGFSSLLFFSCQHIQRNLIIFRGCVNQCSSVEHGVVKRKNRSMQGKEAA